MEERDIKKILVVGSKKFKDEEMIHIVLTVLEPETIVIGNSRGAERLALQFAKTLGCEIIEYNTEYKTFGQDAIKERNRRMYEENDIDTVVAICDYVDTLEEQDCLAITKRAAEDKKNIVYVGNQSPDFLPADINEEEV